MLRVGDVHKVLGLISNHKLSAIISATHYQAKSAVRDTIDNYADEKRHLCSGSNLTKYVDNTRRVYTRARRSHIDEGPHNYWLPLHDLIAPIRTVCVRESCRRRETDTPVNESSVDHGMRVLQVMMYRG